MADQNTTITQTTAPVDATVTPVPETSMSQAPAIESDEKFFAALGYLAFLFVIPLIVKPKSAYCKFHARQSMVMFLGAIIVLVILGLIPWFGSILTMALFALYVLAIYKSYNGEMWSIPVVSTFAGKMDLEKLYGKAGLAVGGISGMKEKATQLANQASEAAKGLGKQEPESAVAETTPATPSQITPTPSTPLPATPVTPASTTPPPTAQK